MPRQKPLGDAEQQALCTLKTRGGSWCPQRPALWDNRHWTIQLLRSLARNGYVAETAADVFVITKKGTAAAEQRKPSSRR